MLDDVKRKMHHKCDSAEHALRDNLLRVEFTASHDEAKALVAESLASLRGEQREANIKRQGEFQAHQGEMEALRGRVASAEEGLEALKKELTRHFTGDFAALQSESRELVGAQRRFKEDLEAHIAAWDKGEAAHKVQREESEARVVATLTQQAAKLEAGCKAILTLISPLI